MKKIIIKILACFILNSKKRKIFRNKYLHPSVNFIQYNSFFTYDKKPIYSDEYNAISDFPNGNIRQKIAIVMQGPLKEEFDFTLETIKIYKKIFSHCVIIVSTWDNENLKLCEQLESMGVYVVKTHSPKKSFLNMNNQIISTREGLFKAKQLGCTYALKTRTDQRLYETNIPEFLLNLLNVFPIMNPVNQKQRLITTSFNTFKYRFYEPSDMFLFGYIDDVINYWDTTLIGDNYENKNVYNLLSFCKMQPSEIYYYCEFLRKTNWKLQWTLLDYWKSLAEKFIIIDTVSVGLYWPKYSLEINRFRNFYGKLNILEELTFKEWLDLYMNNGIKQYIPEWYAKHANIASDDLVIDNKKIFISLKDTSVLDKFDLSKYQISKNIDDNLLFVIIDSYSEQLLGNINNIQIPIIYINYDTINIKKYSKNVIVVNYSKDIIEDLLCLRFFSLKKGE